MVYEYKVIPAPLKGRKARGVRKPEDKFALAVQESMNEMAQLGWEFLRSETLPNTERTGLTRRTTTERSVLVFRREIIQEPKSSLEATLREVEKPKTTVPPMVADAPVEDVQEPKVAQVQTTHAELEETEQTVVPISKSSVAETPPVVETPELEQKQIAAIDRKSFPDPRGPRDSSEALYSKDSIKPAKTARTNALPAALRSRASQSQDGKKA